MKIAEVLRDIFQALSIILIIATIVAYQNGLIDLAAYGFIASVICVAIAVLLWLYVGFGGFNNVHFEDWMGGI